MKNQMMSVKLGDFGTLNIGHKDQFGKVQDVITACNYSDSLKGGKGKYSIQQALRSVDFWKYVIEIDLLEKLENKEVDFNSAVTAELKRVKVIANYDVIYENLDNENKVNYSKLIKMFPNLIKSKRGKYGGTWAKLPILLKIASNADKAIEAVIYKTFIEGKILIHRDNGGEAFKKLNNLIDLLPDRIERAKEKNQPIVKSNKRVYSNIAKLVNSKVKGSFARGWNKEEDSQGFQIKRDEILNMLTVALEMGFIRSYAELKSAISRYEIKGGL